VSRAALIAAALALFAAGPAGAGAVEPADFRMDHFRAPVPETLAGAQVVDDETAHGLWEAGEVAFIDVLPRPPKPDNLPAGTVWRDKLRLSIPGAIWLPNVGYGALHADTHAYFRAGLEAATGANLSHPVLFFCLADCWMSWNAAKRALEYGYTTVYWYPGGTTGWEFFDWPTEKTEPFPAS
jgi:PQQ-dependent catabolism-associated CXXCW motif protein